MVRGRPLIAYIHGEGEDGDGQCYCTFHIDITRKYVYMCEGREGGGGFNTWIYAYVRGDVKIHNRWM